MSARPIRLAFAVAALAGRLGAADDAKPVARWTFDDGSPEVARDVAAGINDRIEGYAAREAGTSGTALRLDGYTTAVVRPAAAAPRLTDGLTFEAWVALQAYPWGRCAILNQADQQEIRISEKERVFPPESEPTAGYFFGLDSDGHLYLQLSLDHHWVTCRSEAMLPLLRWSHVAGTYDSAAGKLALYLDGRRVATAPGHGVLTPATGIDLLVGRNHLPRPPEHPIRLNIPALYALDGRLDDVRIYDRALGADEIARQVEAQPAPADSGLRYVRLPDPKSATREFGAYYTRLRFTDAWDALRRDGPDSDVVVFFGDRPWKYVFWRGTSYIPHWVTGNGIWYTNEFNETWGNGALGCAEPMSDKQTRFSRVSIVENSPARVVIHWRYALVDTRYVSPRVDPLTGWGDWSDEYHIIYPDGIGVRKITLWSTQPREPHEFQESIVLVPPGSRPEDVIATEAVTMINLAGDVHTYSWADGAPARLDRPANAVIEVINVRAPAKPFLVVPDGPFEIYGVHHDGPLFRPFVMEVKRENSIFPWWNHWPVAQIPSDGRWATHPDRVGHSSLSTGLEWRDWADTFNSRTRIMLHGLTELSPARLAAVARSWLRAPMLTVQAAKGGTVQSAGYDESERAYVLRADKSGAVRRLTVALAASEAQPLYHPAFLFKDWGGENVKVTVDGHVWRPGPDLGVGTRRTIDGRDLIVWLRLERSSPCRIRFERRP